MRDLSRRLDGWEPDSFLVGPEEVEAAEAPLPDELKEHIAFAQAQVRDFAERQLATLLDLDVETLPGVRLGHRHVPVDAVGSYVPGGRYPMLASAFMTVVVPKVAGVERVVALRAAARGTRHPPGDAARDGDLGRRPDRLPRRRPGARRDGVRPRRARAAST